MLPDRSGQNGFCRTGHAPAADTGRPVKPEFLHKNSPMVKTTTHEKVREFSPGNCEIYVNQK